MQEEKDVKDVGESHSIISETDTPSEVGKERENMSKEETESETEEPNSENVEIVSGPGPSSPSGIEELNERILEIEDLQMLLEAEMVKLKEFLLERGEKLDITQEKTMKDLQKKVASLEERLEKIGAGVPGEGIMQKIEERIKHLRGSGIDEDRIKALESKIEALKHAIIEEPSGVESGIIEGLRKDIDAIKQSYNEKTKDIDEQIKSLSSDIENLKSTCRSVNSFGSYIEELKKDIDNLKDELQTEFKKEILLQANHVEKIEKNMEQNLAEIRSKIDKIEELVENSGKMLTQKGMDMFLEKIRSARAEMKKDQEELNRSREMINQLILALGKIKDKAETADAVLQKVEAAITKMNTIEEKVRNDIQRLDSLDRNIEEKFSKTDEKLAEVEKIGADIDATRKIFEDKMKNNINNMKAINDAMNERLEAMDKRLQTAEQLADHVRSKVDQLSAIESRTRQIKNDFDKKVASIEAFRSMVEEKSKALDEGLRKISELEQEMENRSKVNEEKFMAYIDNMNALKDAVYTKIDSLNQMTIDAEKIQSKIDQASDIVRKIETMSSGVENKIRRFDSAMRDIEEIKARLSEKSPETDLEEKIKKDLDDRIVSLVTKNLEKFAETLDRKLPELVTKDELMRMKAIPLSVSSPAPTKTSMHNIEDRIRRLEQRLSDIEMRVASGSGAFVIE